MSFTNNSRIVVGGRLQIKKDRRKGSRRSKQKGKRRAGGAKSVPSIVCTCSQQLCTLMMMMGDYKLPMVFLEKL